ncbi:hypothetical protein K503DRAFT_787843, partial [Rhizopogon vinicolor AM-OR11-026]
CSVRIWDLKTNQQAGEPLLHDDHLLALAISSDGQYIASAGLDKKICLWSIEAALEKGGDQVRERATLSGDVLGVSAPSKRKAHSRVLPRYGDDFWGNDTNRTPHRSAPLPEPSPPRRNLFDFLRFNLRPVETSQQLPLQSRRRNFSLFTGRTSVPTVDVAPARDEDRYGISPPTDAEVAAAMVAALQQASGSAVDGQTLQGQAAAVVQGSQVVTQRQPSQLTPGQKISPGIEEPSYAIACCGFDLHFLRVPFFDGEGNRVDGSLLVRRSFLKSIGNLVRKVVTRGRHELQTLVTKICVTHHETQKFRSHSTTTWCGLTDEDTQLAARVEAIPASAFPSHYPLPTRCHERQHATTARNRLSLDHVLSRLEGELQKSHETGTKLISLSMSMNDIRDIFGVPAAHGSLASHVDKVCALRDVIDERDTITAEGTIFLDLIHASSLRTNHHSKMNIHVGHNLRESAKHDTFSIYAIAPHALEGVVDEREREGDWQHAGRRKNLETGANG